MKLRSKKTGDIWKLNINGDGDLWVSNGFQFYDIDSIKQLADTFEDVEPEEVWYIDFQGVIRLASKEENDWFKENEIGNYFETKEEAEKAVEKLKAWKRLKDAGVRFDECRPEYQRFEIYYVIPERPVKEYDQIFADIYLLFGGEE